MRSSAGFIQGDIRRIEDRFAADNLPNNLRRSMIVSLQHGGSRKTRLLSGLERFPFIPAHIRKI